MTDYDNLTNRPTLNTNITTSQPVSESELITGEMVLHKISKTGDYNDLLNKPTIPTKTSDLTNDSGFIDNSVSNLTNYYLKSETYSQTEINNLLNNKVDKTTTIAGIDLQDNITVAELVDALKIEMLKIENPVGHIRMETTDTNPADYLGFGTWVLWGSGRVPVSVDTTDDDFKTVEKTGGEKTHKHLSPETWFSSGGDYVGTTNKYGFTKVYDRDFYGAAATKTEYTTSSEKLAYFTSTESNVQPYITCYMWKRTA